MNRRKLEEHLRAQGCAFYHHGGRHDIWINLRTLRQTSIPRHREVKEMTARAICKALGVSPSR